MKRLLFWSTGLALVVTPAWADTPDPDGNEYLIMAAAIYFLPFLIALSRGHLSSGAIFLVNLLFGWTVLGWFFALIWSATGNTRHNLRRSMQGVVTVREITAEEPTGERRRGNIIIGGKGPPIQFTPRW